jgi:hypothetical protein
MGQREELQAMPAVAIRDLSDEELAQRAKRNALEEWHGRSGYVVPLLVGLVAEAIIVIGQLRIASVSFWCPTCFSRRWRSS